MGKRGGTRWCCCLVCRRVTSTANIQMHLDTHPAVSRALTGRPGKVHPLDCTCGIHKPHCLSEATRGKIRRKLLNHSVSEETRVKMRMLVRDPVKNASRSRKVSAHWASLTPEAKASRLRNMITWRGPTSIELAIQEVLDLTDICYSTQVAIGSYRVDILISGCNLIVECDGCYFHDCGVCGFEGRADKEYAVLRDVYLQECGYAILHVLEHAIRKDPMKALLDSVEWVRKERDPFELKSRDELKKK